MILSLIDQWYVRLHTCIGEAQLPASNSGIDKEEIVVTDSSPLVGITDFQTSSHVVSSSPQSDVTLATHCQREKCSLVIVYLQHSYNKDL